VGNILVKGISPKFRILLAGTMALSFSFSRDLRTVLLLTGYGALLALCGELPLRNVVRNLLRIEGVFLCLWCTLPFTSGGASFSLGGVSLSVEGVRLALLISLKGAGMMLALAGLFGGIPVHMLFQAFQELGFSSKLVGIFHFCFRYLHLLQEERRRLFDAAALRGFRPSLLPRSLATLAFLGANLLIKSYDRSRRVQEALLLRGFQGFFPPSESSSPPSRGMLLRFSTLLLFLGGCFWF
jgi:cobalt/nickel transport system permease protein